MRKLLRFSFYFSLLWRILLRRIRTLFVLIRHKGKAIDAYIFEVSCRLRDRESQHSSNQQYDVNNFAYQVSPKYKFKYGLRARLINPRLFRMLCIKTANIRQKILRMISNSVRSAQTHNDRFSLRQMIH